MEVCSECYPNQSPCWRDAPMNEEIRKHLTWQRTAIVYYYTLTEALTVWGQQIEEKYHEN